MGPAITVADFVPLNLCGNHGDNSVLPGPKTSEPHAMYSSRSKAPTGDPMKPIYLAERVMLASPNSEPFKLRHPMPASEPSHERASDISTVPMCGRTPRANKASRSSREATRTPGKLTLSRRAATILLPD